MDDNRDWRDEINIDELPDPYKQMAKVIGIQHTIAIAEMYQGTGFYLPKLDNTLNRIRDKKLKKEFNGGNYKDLAIKYGLSERWVREIISGDPSASYIQESIFDLNLNPQNS